MIKFQDMRDLNNAFYDYAMNVEESGGFTEEQAKQIQVMANAFNFFLEELWYSDKGKGKFWTDKPEDKK